jgi:transposase
VWRKRAVVHYWARKLEGFGHTVKLMSPQFVKAYVKTNNMMRPMPRR